MPKIAVVTDSAACIPAALREELHIHQVAFELIWEGKVSRDGTDITPAEFYRRFRSCAHAYPITSQPPLLERTSCAEFYLTEFAPVMGAHTGPDLIGIAFYVDD